MIPRILTQNKSDLTFLRPQQQEPKGWSLQAYGQELTVATGNVVLKKVKRWWECRGT